MSVEITDEIAEAAWCAFRDSDKPAPYSQVKDAIVAVAPLIEAQARASNWDYFDLRDKCEAKDKEIAALRAELAQARAAAMEPVLAEFEKRSKDVPVGHENKCRGASTYNWRMSHLKEIREIASLLSRPVSEREGEKA